MIMVNLLSNNPDAVRTEWIDFAVRWNNTRQNATTIWNAQEEWVKTLQKVIRSVGGEKLSEEGSTRRAELLAVVDFATKMRGIER